MREYQDGPIPSTSLLNKIRRDLAQIAVAYSYFSCLQSLYLVLQFTHGTMEILRN